MVPLREECLQQLQLTQFHSNQPVQRNYLCRERIDFLVFSGEAQMMVELGLHHYKQ